jgi:hypothetical protein
VTAGFGLDPAALQETADGINATISELKTLGIDEGAELGRGFSGLSLTGMQVGHAGLQGAFDQFCERWSWGARTLVQDGNEIAARIGLAAGMYKDVENYAIGTLKDLIVDASGNPHADAKTVENESWSQIASDSAAHPDYSAQSWDKAGQDMAAQWKAEGRDLAEGPFGLGKKVADMAGNGAGFAHAEGQVFGAAPKQAGGS